MTSPTPTRKPHPLTRAETTAFADSVRAILADPDANLSRDARLRWEGALTALEAVLGRAASLTSDTTTADLIFTPTGKTRPVTHR